MLSCNNLEFNKLCSFNTVDKKNTANKKNMPI